MSGSGNTPLSGSSSPASMGTPSSNKLGLMQRLMSIRTPKGSVASGAVSAPIGSGNGSPHVPVMFNSVKLVVVGQENVGKTHLCKQMENSKYSTNVSTDGIEISSWNSGKGKNLITFTTFDFGGQEIFYPTHQFFLTSRCVYLIAFRLDEPDYLERVMYWVRTIQSSIPYASAPPIVLVGTHLDCQSDTSHIRKELENMTRKFKLIQDIVFVSSTKGTNVSQLKASILSLAIRRKLALEPVPKYYLDLWEAVGSASASSPFCSFDTYRAMAEKCGVPMDSAFTVVTKFLHDVGRLIYFGGRDASSSNAVILDPGWLAARMTDLISFKQNWQRGVVDMARLAIIWKQFDQSLQDSILGILEKFHVVFFKRSRLKGSVQSPTEVVVPSLLPEFVDMASVSVGLCPVPGLLLRRRTYSFKWIPLGFAARLISLFHSHAEFRVEEQWRNGLVLCSALMPACRSIITCEANYKKNTFQLHVTCTAEEESEVGIGRLNRKSRKLSDEISESENAAEDDDEDDSDTTVDGTTPVSAYLRRTLMHEVVSVIDGLMRDFCSHSPAELDVVCSYCMRDSPTATPGTFRFDVLVQLFTTNKDRIPCATCFELLPIPLLAPDITFSFLPLVKNLTMGPLLGRGGFGSVYKGTLKNGVVVAVKELAAAGDDEAIAERFRQFQHEVCMMSLVSHPNLVRMHGVMLQPRPRIVMEFCPLPDLSEILYGKRSEKILLNYSQKLAVAFDVASALAYLHSQSSPIVHRDVRSPNVFIVSLDVSAPVVCKLGDYGLAATVVSKLTESLNTFQWLAPEVLSGAQYDESVDVYSLSMVMHELMANKMPFTEYRNFFTVFTQWTSFHCRLCGEGEVCQQTEECQQNQVERVETGEKFIWKEQTVKDAIIQGNLRPSIPPYCPLPLAELIRSGWSREASSRPTARQVASLLADIMSEGGTDMSMAEVEQLRDRVRRGGAILAEASSVSLDLERHSSSLQLLLMKNPKIVVADPSLLETVGACKVKSLIRIERTIFVGCGNGEITVLHNWGRNVNGEEGSASAMRSTVAHNGEVMALASFSLPSEDLLWSAGADGTVQVWSLSKGHKKLKKKYSVKHGGVVTCMDSTEGFVVCCFETGDVVLFKPGEKEAVMLACSSPLRVPIYSCCVRETLLESLIIVGALGKVYVFSAERNMGLASTLPKVKTIVLQQDYTSAVDAMVMVENEFWAASGSRIHSFSNDKFEPLRTMQMDVPVLAMITVVFSDFLLVWVGGRDKVIVLDAVTKAVLSSMTTPDASNALSLVKMSHDIVLSGDSSGCLYMWEFCC